MKRLFKIILSVFKVVITLLIVLIFLVIFVQRITKNNVKFLGYGLYTVVTESMYPDYKIYDMILTREVDPSTIKVDDDIVYMGMVDDFKDKIVTHRVIKVKHSDNGYRFVTKGINNMIEDPEIEDSQMLGKVLFKSTVLSFLSKITNNIYGFYFIVFVPLVIIIFLEIMETINEKKEYKKGLNNT